MKPKLERLIQLMTESMTAARETADGQAGNGVIILPLKAYRKLYCASLAAKQVLEALKDTL